MPVAHLPRSSRLEGAAPIEAMQASHTGSATRAEDAAASGVTFADFADFAGGLLAGLAGLLDGEAGGVAEGVAGGVAGRSAIIVGAAATRESAAPAAGAEGDVSR